MKIEFLDKFSINTEIESILKIRLVGDELLHVDGEADMTKLIVSFRKFANAPKNR
jgi:hypothetical protein